MFTTPHFFYFFMNEFARLSSWSLARSSGLSCAFDRGFPWHK
jgi:hypothetical protein